MKPKSPDDPRRHLRHHERAGGILIKVRWTDIAKASGLSIHTVKKYGTGGKRRFDPRDFADVVRFILYRSRKATAV